MRYDPRYGYSSRSSSDPPPARPARPQHAAWRYAGIAVAVVLVIGGLAVVGAIVVFLVSLSHYGSNK